MKKRIRACLSWVMAAVLMTGAFPAPAAQWAAETLFGGLLSRASAASVAMEGTCGESLFWSLDAESGVLTVSGAGDMEDYSNTQLSPWCESGKWQLVRHAVLEENVTRIGDCAFASCLNLQTVCVPSGVTEIGSGAFSNCHSLQSVQFGKDSALQRIGAAAFAGCGLTQIDLPENTSILETLSFSGVKLRELRLPYAVSFIDKKAIESSVPLLGYSGSAAEQYAETNGNPFTALTLQPGENHVAWSLSTDRHTLTIHGIGAIPDYASPEEAPWYAYRPFINTVCVEDGIVSIGNNAFAGSVHLQRVQMAPSVTRIGNMAFFGCYALDSVQLSVQLTEIGYKAFSSCSALREIALPNSVQSVGLSAFGVCGALESVTLPEGMMRLSNRVFSNCGSLREIRLPGSIREIGSAAFMQCSRLAFVRIPASVEDIRSSAFYACPALQSVLIPPTAVVEDVHDLKENGTTVYTENTFLCLMCQQAGVSYIEIPAGFGTVGDGVSWSYDYNSGTLQLDGAGAVPDYASVQDTPWAAFLPFIETVQVGSRITSVGRFAFSGCTRCRNAVFLSGETRFEAQSFAQTVHIFAPEASAAAVCAQSFSMPFSVHLCSGVYGNALWTVDTFEQVLSVTGSGIPSASGVAEVPWYTYAQQIASVEIGQDITQIGSYAFACCENVRQFFVPEVTEQIGEHAFPNGSLIFGETDSAAQIYAQANGNPFAARLIRGECGDALTWSVQTQYRTLTISGTGAMPDFAAASDAPWYAYRRSFDSVDCLYGVTAVGKNAFAGNPFLQRAALSQTVASIHTDGFSGCTALHDVQLSEGLLQIGEGAFADCAALKKAEIPASVRTVGAQAFSGCTSLKHCVFAEDAALSSLGSYAFANCMQLSEMVLPAGVQSLGEGAFSYCSEMYKLSMENAQLLKEVPAFCCKSCRALTELFFPDSLRVIGESAFRYNTQLGEVTLPAGVQTVEQKAFDGCDRLHDAWIPGQETQIGSNAFELSVTIHALNHSAAMQYAQTNGNRFVPLCYSGECGSQAKWEYDPQNDILILSAQTAGAPAVVSEPAWQSVIKTPASVYIDADIRQIQDGILSAGSTLFGDAGTEAQAYAGRNDLPFSSKTKKGSCGTQLFWELDLFKQTLTVFGSGKMTDWNTAEDVPWHDVRGRIQFVSVESGTASLGGYALCGTQISSLILPESVTQIGTGAVDSGVTLYGKASSAVQNWAKKNGNPFFALDVFDVNKLTQLESIDEQHPVQLTFTAQESRNYILFSQGAADASVRVLDAGNAEIGADDDAGDGKNFSLTVPLQAGKTYRIIVSAGEARESGLLIGFYALYTIRYDANGGGDAPGLQQKRHGESLNLRTEKPSRKDCIFKGWALSPTAKAPQFGEGGSMNTNRDLTLYAVWASAKTLSIRSLTYSFDNSANSFGYTQDYKIPKSIYTLVFGDTVKKNKLYEGQSEWSGNCFGISCTSSMFNNPLSSVKVQDFNENSTDVFQLQADDFSSSLDLNVRSFIEVMQVSQNSSLIWNDTQVNKNKLSVLAAAAEDAERTGEALVVCVYRTLPNGKYSGHALTAYALKRVSRNESRLYVYDSNFPGEERYIVLFTDNTGSPTGWYYDADPGEYASDNSDCFITFVPYSHFYEVWDKRGKEMEIQTGSLIVNAASYSIWNEEGQKIASCRNGVFSSNHDAVFLATYISGTQDVYTTGEVVLPTGHYTIRNEDSSLEWFEVQMIHCNLGAFVRTTADEVTVAVDDATNTNLIAIPAEQNAQYDMTLFSSIQSDYAQVRLTGEGTGNAVSVSQSEGDVQLANAAGAELYLNEEKCSHMPEDIESVSIQTAPRKTIYRYRESGVPDLAGISVCVCYQDGVTEIVDDETALQATPIHTRQRGKQQVQVTYHNAQAVYTIEVQLTFWERLIEFFFGWIMR